MPDLGIFGKCHFGIVGRDSFLTCSCGLGSEARSGQVWECLSRQVFTEQTSCQKWHQSPQVLLSIINAWVPWNWLPGSTIGGHPARPIPSARVLQFFSQCLSKGAFAGKLFGAFQYKCHLPWSACLLAGMEKQGRQRLEDIDLP